MELPNTAETIPANAEQFIEHAYVDSNSYFEKDETPKKEATENIHPSTGSSTNPEIDWEASSILLTKPKSFPITSQMFEKLPSDFNEVEKSKVKNGTNISFTDPDLTTEKQSINMSQKKELQLQDSYILQPDRNAYVDSKLRKIQRQNDALVKNIIKIQRRKTQFTDRLESKIGGQNIYNMVGHSRSQIQLAELCQSNGKIIAPALVHLDLPKATMVKSIPQTNLFQRKISVLKNHKQNIRLVRKLETMQSVTNSNLPSPVKSIKQKSPVSNKNQSNVKYMNETQTSVQKRTISATDLELNRYRQSRRKQHLKVHHSMKMILSPIMLQRSSTELQFNRRHKHGGFTERTSVVKRLVTENAMTPIRSEDSQSNIQTPRSNFVNHEPKQEKKIKITKTQRKPEQLKEIEISASIQTLEDTFTLNPNSSRSEKKNKKLPFSASARVSRQSTPKLQISRQMTPRKQTIPEMYSVQKTNGTIFGNPKFMSKDGQFRMVLSHSLVNLRSIKPQSKSKDKHWLIQLPDFTKQTVNLPLKEKASIESDKQKLLRQKSSFLPSIQKSNLFFL